MGGITVQKIKIAYIGGGSKMWARVFMADLAVAEGLGGEMALYDIDIPAAERNAAIGGYINATTPQNPGLNTRYTKIWTARSRAPTSW